MNIFSVSLTASLVAEREGSQGRNEVESVASLDGLLLERRIGGGGEQDARDL